jgi:molybdate transport system substrate-binding protein
MAGAGAMRELNLLSAGAAQGLVHALQPGFTASTGARLQCRFGAVGAMKEALLAGDRCDVMVLTDAMVDQLCAAGHLRAQGRRSLGRVRTGIAVRQGQAQPDVATPQALKAALLAADAVYFPDPVRATAGIHFANVMRQLGVFEVLAPRLHSFANGATAMRELADSSFAQPIGCTQVTEIGYTAGVSLVAALPPAFELATVYSAAVATAAADAALAAQLVDWLGGAASLALRRATGFEP